MVHVPAVVIENIHFLQRCHGRALGVKAGDMMTDALTLQKLINAFWAGLKVRNTGTGDAAIQAAAANRDFSSSVHVEFGQRANGSGYL